MVGLRRERRKCLQWAVASLLMLLQMMAEVRSREMCKASSDTSKFELEKIHKGHLELGGLTVGEVNYTIYAHMCRDLDMKNLTGTTGSPFDYTPEKSGLKPNVVLKVERANSIVEYKDIAFYYGNSASVTSPWVATVFTYKGAKPSSGLEYARILRSENVTTVAIEFTTTTFKDVVAKVLFLNTCFRDTGYHFYDNYYIKATKTVVFQYNGPRACGVEIPDYIEFLANSIIFVLILGVSAFLGLVLGKENERLIMALSGVQASIMSLTSLLFLMRESWIDIGTDTTKHVYAMLCLLCASVSFGLSYFHRLTSLAFVCVSVSFAVVWTLLYLFMLFFQRNVSIGVYLSGNILVVSVIVLVSTRSEKIREKYSYYLYTAVTNSFYGCLAIFVYFSKFKWALKFIDIVNFNNFREFGKEDSVTFQHWYFIFVQSLLTAVTVYRQVRQGRKLSRKHNERRGSRAVSERPTANDLFGEPKHVNETLIAM